MEDVLLSICISSYNRGDKCQQLVNRILTIEDDRYNIFLCDDHSDEDTRLKLRSLVSQKVTLIQNEGNIGPCPNWFQTIDSGNGRYILHVLDRDDIDVSYLPTILDILEHSSVGAGYFGRSAMSPVEGMKKQTNFAICKKGREAFLTMGVPIHPTGFLVERETWKQGDFRKFFYESDTYGIYPHAYVLGIIASRKDELYSPIPFYRYMYRMNNMRSRFYTRSKKKDYWWLPDSVMKTDNRLMIYLIQFADDAYKEEFVYRRFRHGLYRATLLYKKIAANQLEMGRYGLSIENIPLWKVLWSSLKYRITFISVLYKLQMIGRETKKEINRIWFENIKRIIKEG